MFGLPNPYLIGGAVIAASLAFGGVYIKGRSDGRSAILNSLQDQRIIILKDGRRIDNKVMGSDSEQLCELLGGCS